MNTEESDSDDEEDYFIKRNKFGAPIYDIQPQYPLETNCKTENDKQLQQIINPFKKVCVWKKAVSFLGSLPVELEDLEWKPQLEGCYSNEEQAIGKWQAQITLTDPYGNIYVQGFKTKKTKRKLSRYQKLSDIMSPNYTPM